MAITPFHTVLTSGPGGIPGGSPIATYTVPAGKYCVFNLFHAGCTQGNLFLNGQPLSEFAFDNFLGEVGYRGGPFTATAGDVLSARLITGGLWESYSVSVNGFLFDTSVTRVPFTARLLQNSATYTVPAGRYAVFSLWTDYRATSSGYFLLGLNGQPYVGAGSPGGGIGNPSTFGRRGTLTAKAGDVLALLSAHTPTKEGAATTTSRCILNGLLYSTTVTGLT